MLRVKGWDDFQHYKDRRPPWIKLHVELLQNFKWHKLNSDSKALAICIWIVACEHEDPKSGLVTDDPEEIAFRAHMDEKTVVSSIKQLIQYGFIEHIKPDDSDLLAPCYQVAAPETEAETYNEEVDKKESLSNFEEFWKSWIPYKTPKGSKADAKEAYLKIRKEIDHADLRKSSGEYCRLCQATDTNTKNVFRWLKKRGWEDDYTIPNRTSPCASNGKPSYSSTILNASERARQQLSLQERAEGEGSIFDTEGSEDRSLLPPPRV